MRVAVFSTKPYDERFLQEANQKRHDLTFYEARLTETTAPLANEHDAVCAFVNDDLNEAVLKQLKENGTRLVALRSAGYNHVDMDAAKELGLTVARVPAYSPFAVAEHALALILALNRQTHRAYNRVREGNFALEGLLGFDLHGKTVGVIGTGKIGATFIGVMSGFGCVLLAYDPYPNDAVKGKAQYVTLEQLFERADIISLHSPLTPDTHHLIDEDALAQMKEGVMIINTSRGALVDTQAAITALKTGRLGYLGLDVYEEEGDLFFEDLSDKVIQDDLFSRLLTFPNVLITGHQAFFTEEALHNIAQTTVQNITAFETGEGELFEVSAE